MESQSHLATTRFLRGIVIEVLHNNEFIFLFNKISDNIDNINKVLLNCWAKNFNGVSIFPNEYFSSKDIIKNLIDRKKIILQSFCLKNIGGKLMKIDYL